MAAALPDIGAKSQASPPLRRDPVFYCQDIVFRVDDVLFKVPRRPFEEDSEIFSNMFTLPPADHPSGIEGSSDMNPLALEGVCAEEFRALLCVLLPNFYGTPRSLTKDQWISALKLADMWFFTGIRNKAIAELRRIISSPAERFEVARRLQIPGWTETALNELAQQDVLSASDLQSLGWDTVSKLILLRECVQLTNTCTCSCSYCMAACHHIRKVGNFRTDIGFRALRQDPKGDVVSVRRVHLRGPPSTVCPDSTVGSNVVGAHAPARGGRTAPKYQKPA
ncbi:hypothetical protein BC628DRAFT_1333984 [Trametes gibbosa]|nr:hypothetical protein BC628DRAFT_1333984 [Trametes gibbosa]